MNSVQEPIFIICTGRSGSTLLRYILDTHDMIDAPQELHIGRMVQEMSRVFRLLHEDEVTDKLELAALVNKAVNAQIETMMRTRLKKEIWCDKSVSSIDFIDDIMRVFPKAKYLFLYRDCLDFVHSALEASKYGFEGFYFEEFVLQTPKNLVDGLVNFWCMQTEKRIELEKQGKHLIHSIRYEDIVKDSKSTVSELFEFLGLLFDEQLLDQVFLKFKPGRGDLKVQSLGSIIDMTGKGRDVPLKHIKEDSFLRMNRVLGKIGYAEINRDYNFTAEGISNADGLGNKSIQRVYDYFSSCLTERPIPTELENQRISIDISGIKDSPWILDFGKVNVFRNQSEVNNVTMKLKLRLDTLLKIIEKELNISWAYKQGMIETNGTYQQLNEVGKYLFG